MNRSAAFELFGQMRHSTLKEQKLYNDMIEKYSIPFKEGDSILNLYEPYYIEYYARLGFTGCPDWLFQAVEDGLVICNHPEEVQDIWDLSWDYEGVPSLTVKTTGKTFRMGGAPITYKDVYGE